MNDLVFLEPNKIDAEPFTTSKIVAEVTGVSHRYIKKQIAQREKELRRFGLLVAHATESTGGRPEEITRLNEQQASVLITFLKNTPVVIEFKVELVRQFYTMRSELNRRHVERAQLKPIRREMTDVIQQVTDSKWSYKLYADLSYKLTVGKIAAKLREERGAPKKAVALARMTADEQKQAVEKRESGEVKDIRELSKPVRQGKPAPQPERVDRETEREQIKKHVAELNPWVQGIPFLFLAILRLLQPL